MPAFGANLADPGQDSKRKTLYNDGMILLCFLYSSADLLVDWADALKCQKDVGKWLLGSYAMIAAFRILSHLGQHYCQEGEEDRVLHIRQQNKVCQVLAWFTWIFLVPAFLGWTALGSYQVLPLVWKGRYACLPMGRPWFVLLCLLLCYCWVVMCTMYFAGILRFEYRLWRAEAALRAIETDESLQRWGRQSFTETENQGLVRSGLSMGLRPEAICALPKARVRSGSRLCGDQCAICLTDFVSGDSARRLPSCQHCFHQECIDLWLLRSAACPLCKGTVEPEPNNRPGNTTVTEVEYFEDDELAEQMRRRVGITLV